MTQICAVLLALGTGFGSEADPSKQAVVKPQATEIVLSDNSVIRLTPGSKLRLEKFKSAEGQNKVRIEIPGAVIDTEYLRYETADAIYEVRLAPTGDLMMTSKQKSSK